ERLLGGTTNPSPDIQFFWSEASDMGWCRANHENFRLWSTLKRLGYQPRIIQDLEFENGAWAEAPALCLSRCFTLKSRHLDIIVSNVVSAGIHIHANADLPGQFDAYLQTAPDWVQRMDYLFGLDVANAISPWDAGAASDSDLGNPQRLDLNGAQALGPLAQNYHDAVGTWKLWQGLISSSGATIVTDTGFRGTNLPLPALKTKTIGSSKTAINTF